MTSRPNVILDSASRILIIFADDFLGAIYNN